jgi:hypothetical protein
VAATILLRLLGRTNREATVIGAVVLGHWVLDLVAHRPDLPLWFGGGPLLGLELWRSVAATLVVEFGLFATGLVLYLRQTRAADARGRWAFWTLIGFLVLVYLVNAFAPPPPAGTSPALIAGPALAFWLVIVWAYWADRHRVPRLAPALA